MNNFELNKVYTAFSNEKKLNRYIRKIKWSNGFICSKCGCTEYWNISKNKFKFKCKNCYYQSTLTTGTMFQKTRLPLFNWLLAIWCVVLEEGAVNATNFQYYSDIGSNRTALNVLNKIRDVMGFIDKEKFCGKVYVDCFPIFINPKNSLKNVYIAISQISETQAKIKMQLEKPNKSFISEFIESCIEENSTIISTKRILCDNNGKINDELPIKYIYKLIKNIEYSHNLSITEQIVAYLKKKNYLDVHHTYCSLAHSERYLSECCYKFNRRDKKKKQMFEEILNYMLHNENNH